MEFEPGHKKCYVCKWRRNIMGDAHSRCVHPLVAVFTQTGLGEIASLLNKALGGSVPQSIIDHFQIFANYHGIKNGWFNWPFNYDPVWLTRCDKFEEDLCG
jgi:hypothetical protein